MFEKSIQLIEKQLKYKNIPANKPTKDHMHYPILTG